MDRRLKERITGAAVLVIFIVLVVPVFLDGPADEADIVTEVVTLPGQEGPQRRRQTIVLERDRTDPVPAAQTATPTTEVGVAEVVASPAQESGKKVPGPTQDEPPAVDLAPVKVSAVATDDAARKIAVPPAAETRSATGMWAVQLGSFSKKENADRLAADLRGKGYAAFLSQVDTAETPLHRVRIGPQSDRDSAEAISAKLARDGIKSQVVPHP